MRKSLLLCGLALALAAAPAGAAGVNFAWNDCFTDGGATNIASACGSNFGTAGSAVGSYVLAGEQPLFVGVEVVIDLQVDAASLPDWWQFFNAGSCRATALSAAFIFPAQSQTNCFDEWSGQALGGIAAYQTSTTNPPNPYPDPARARIKLAAAVANPIDLPPSIEFLSFVLNISNTNTTTCTGCGTPATIVLNSIKSAQQDASFEFLSDPIGNNCIKYYAGTVPCATLPANNTSWGQVKSLYR